MKRFSVLYKTNDHMTGLLLRITLAVVMLPHGCQQLFGWFGGLGFSNTMNYLTQVEGLPWIVGCMVILLQSFGSLLILFGFLSRFFAFAMTCLFIGMIITSHWQHGLFMNWMGNQQGEGFEFHLLAIGITLSLLANGSGAYSIDAQLTKGSENDNYSLDLTNIYQ